MPRSSPFNPLLLLELAQRLDHADEAELRTIINRVYYGIHLRTRQGLEAMGHSFPGDANAHAAVWRELKKTRFDAGNRLSSMFESRVMADYDLEAETSALGARMTGSLDDAQYISKALENAWATLPK